ncbi:DNA mismatch repair protein MutS [Candidatus Zixiibacteriota bacterium]
MNKGHNPHGEYLRRLENAGITTGLLKRRSRRLSDLRVATALTIMAVVIFSVATGLISAGWAVVPFGVFICLVMIHAKTEREMNSASLIFSWYEEAISRLEHTWHGKGIQRSDLASEDHPYAADLDLFGPGSLFELLCRARTQSGEETLASWLLAPASPSEIRIRQEAVRELQPQLDLREDLAVLGGGLRSAVDPARIRTWAESPSLFDTVAVNASRIAAFILSAGLITTFILWAANGSNPLPFWLFVLAIWGFHWLHGGKMMRISRALEEPHRELKVLSHVLRRLEDNPAECDRLKQLRDSFTAGGLTASTCINRLDRLITWLDAGRNIVFAPIAYGLLWHFHFSVAIEAWRKKAGIMVGQWLDSVGEYEAFCSLASYAWEHPDASWPEIVDEGPLFEGDDLGHPLLPAIGCVENSVHLGRSVTGWVVSGSNMSGKSTLLRTVGVNAVLAFCGAPARATRLTLSPLSIGATIRIEDSLQAGTSRFYAEISRLKDLMDIAGRERPLLFLLDEILHGTNSHDRQVGAAAVVKSLISAGAIGLVTTHDLALSQVADDLGDRAVNMHFEDRLENGKLIFDYRIKPGVVQRGNALDLMRSIGLDV